MDTSDDPVTITAGTMWLIGGAAAAGTGISMEAKRKAASKAAAAQKRMFQGLRQDDDETKIKTATALGQQSERKKMNKRRSASLLTRDFGAPTLGQRGLLGAS